MIVWLPHAQDMSMPQIRAAPLVRMFNGTERSDAQLNSAVAEQPSYAGSTSCDPATPATSCMANDA
eukprot:2404733-Heterocapsa_arctica.AAC.1